MPKHPKRAFIASRMSVAKTYVKVTGKYDATLVASQQDASYIQVGIEKKLSDGTYKVNSLASTYG